VLLDACVWGAASEVLRAAGNDVECVADWRTDPGDEEVLARAHAAGRVLVTLDRDFGELAVVRGVPHSGIVRLVAVSAREQGAACLQVMERYGAELAQGAIVTLEPGRIRVRPPEPLRTGE
jgi:predicted nuclease of predicted toxin-antitoxin system